MTALYNYKFVVGIVSVSSDGFIYIFRVTRPYANKDNLRAVGCWNKNLTYNTHLLRNNIDRFSSFLKDQYLAFKEAESVRGCTRATDTEHLRLALNDHNNEEYTLLQHKLKMNISGLLR